MVKVPEFIQSRVAIMVFAVVSLPGRAYADDWSLHLVLGGQAGLTDNVFSVPRNDPDGAPLEADLLVQLRPGALLTYASGRVTQELSLDVDALAYLSHSEAWSASTRGAWRSHYVLSPFTEATLGAGAATGTLNAMVARAGVNTETPVGGLPAGASTFKSVDASQQLAHALSAETRIYQTAGAQFVRTTEPSTANPTVDANTDALTASLGGGIDRSWRSHALGVNVTGAWMRFERAVPMPGMPALEKQLNISTMAQWRYDVNPRWTTAVEGGVVTVVPLVAQYTALTLPAVSANVFYSERWGTAGANIFRSISPNVFLAQNTVNTGLTLTANMPITRWAKTVVSKPKWTLLGATGLTLTQLVNTSTGALESDFSLFHLDAALQYAPSTSTTLTTRYQFMRQSGSEDGAAVIQGYARNTLLLEFAFRYPSEQAGVMPKKRTLRVDQAADPEATLTR